MMLKVRSYGFLFLLILPAVISACSKDWRNDGQAGDLVPISFSCGASPSVTVKAGASFAASNQLIANQHFAVYGWDTEDDFFFDGGTGPGAPDFWNGTTPMDVTFHDNEDRGKNNTYIIEAPLDMMARYWPRSTTPAYCYTFWAYYPYFSGNGIDVRSYSDPSYTDGTVGIFDFAVQSTPAAMVDFCMSDVANDIVYDNTNSLYPGTVALTFHHALTRVQFKFERSSDVADGTTIKLLEAQLQNVYTTGTLTATYAQRTPAPALGRAGTTSLEWSAQGTPDDFEITVGGVDPDDAVPARQIELVTSPGDPAQADIFLMVPQTMLTSGAGSHQDLYIKWSVDNGSGAVTYDATVLLDECKTGVGQATDANIDWAPNQFVTYTIVIGAKPIEFDVSVSIKAWEEDVDGYYPIIS